MPTGATFVRVPRTVYGPGRQIFATAFAVAVFALSGLAGSAHGAAWVAERISGAGADVNDFYGPHYEWASPTGATVLFGTSLRLTNADQDDGWDLYRWHAGVVSLVTGGNVGYPNRYHGRFNAAVGDGTDVIFTTDERLVPGDTDAADDIYLANGGNFILLSGQPVSAVPARFSPNAVFGGATPDGSHVFFTTSEGLVPQDVDGDYDVYEWTPSRIRMVSRGVQTCDRPDSSNDATDWFVGSSSDATRVLIDSVDQLSPSDTDCQPDIYGSTESGWELVVPGDGGGGGILGISPDAKRVLIKTSRQLNPNDRDGISIYLYDHGTFRWLTPSSATTAASNDPLAVGNADLTQVVLESSLSHLPADLDTQRDIYQWNNGTLRLLTPGTSGNLFFTRFAANGQAAVFDTYERLSPADLYSDTLDLYRATPSGLQLLSHNYLGVAGPACGTPLPGLMSSDASRVYTDTPEPLAPEDVCIEHGYREGEDLYELTGASSNLVRPRGRSIFGIEWGGEGMRKVTPDGFIIRTAQPLTADDQDGVPDLFRVWFDPDATPDPGGDPAPDPEPGPDPDPGPGPDPSPDPDLGPTAPPTMPPPSPTLGANGSADASIDRTAPTTYARLVTRRARSSWRIRFSTSEPATTWCRFDRKRFRVCSSPVTVRRLKPGRHRISLFSVDRFGNTERPWKTLRFRVRR